jgi:hypothetical protein
VSISAPNQAAGELELHVDVIKKDLGQVLLKLEALQENKSSISSIDERQGDWLIQAENDRGSEGQQRHKNDRQLNDSETPPS